MLTIRFYATRAAVFATVAVAAVGGFSWKWR